MSDESQVIRGIDWKTAFPFVGLFRGFRVAIHPSKLLLGLSGLLLIYFGGHLLDAMWSADSRAVPNELGIYALAQNAPHPSEEFYKRRFDARKAVVDTFNSELRSIGKDPADSGSKNAGKLADLEWSITQQLNKDVQAANDVVDKLSDADKKDDAKLAAAKKTRDALLATDYTEAADRLHEVRQIQGTGLFETFCDYQLNSLNRMVAGVRYGNWVGNGGVVDAIHSFFVFAPIWALHSHTLYFTIFFLYFLCIWSVFGGAIARIAAVHVARDEKISVRQALRFSTSKFLSFFSAPIIPILIVTIVGLVIGVAAILGNIPFLGPIIIGLFFFLALIAGFVMTLVVLGTAGGFNLMYSTIAVEGSDSFDAISRSFSYLYARPWRMAFYSAVAITYGSICYLFVRFFLYVMLNLTQKFVGLLLFRSADNAMPMWTSMWPGSHNIERLAYDVNYLPLGPGQKIGAFLVMVWIYLAIGLLGAFAVSFYFSANTIIYFLMRHEVDATELDDVYLEQSDDEFADTATTSPTTTVETTTVVTTITTPAPAAPPAPETSTESQTDGTPPSA